MIPGTVQEVFLKKIDIKRVTLKFNPHDWGNVTLLDIQSGVGFAFKDRHQPIFNALPNLETLGIHAIKLRLIDKETLLGLHSLKTLDLSNSVRLNIDDVTKLLSMNSSVANVTSLNLGYVNTVRRSSPTTLNKYFFELLRQRKIKTLNLHGMKFVKIDFKSLRTLCQSLQILNISKVIYILKSGDITKDSSPCHSIKVIDISEWNVRFLALQYIRNRFSSQKPVSKFEFNLTGFSSLHTIYANSLDFGFSEFEIRLKVGYFTCSRCFNIEHLKNIYLRDNRLKWLNVSSDISCRSFKLELIDLSSNGLEYLSPSLLEHIVTLEDINLRDNSLHVMETFAEFNSLFTSFSKLRKVTLSANGFTYLPQNIFERNINLKFIDVSNNKLSSLPGTLKELVKLNWLDLRKNDFHILSGDNFVYFSSFIERRLNNSDSDFSLRLSENLFTCSCEGSQLIKWLFIYLIPKIRPDPALQCLLDGAVVNIDNTAVLKSQHLCEKNSVVSVSAVLSVSFSMTLVGVGVFLGLFFRRRRRNCRREKFIHSFKNGDENFKYVVFLIFCSKDEQLIQDVIFPSLSRGFMTIFNTKENLVCAGVNEYRLGQTIFSEMERCIRQSAVAIYVHNQNSAKCARCKREMKMACEKDKQIAVILDEDVEDDLISPLLHMVINKSLKLSLVKDGFEWNSNKSCRSILDLAIKS